MGIVKHNVKEHSLEAKCNNCINKASMEIFLALICNIQKQLVGGWNLKSWQILQRNEC